MRSADRRQLDRVVGLVREVLGRDAVAAYLFGSAVLGGLRPHSDLDVLVVTTRPTMRDEKQQFVDGLLAISGRETAKGRWRRVELTVVVRSDVKPWRYPPKFDFQYGDWLRGAFEGGDIEPWATTTMPDLASLITMVLLADAPLFGPQPAEVLDPVPHEDLVRAILGEVDSLLLNLDADTRNVILTLARIWETVATGEIHAKDAAAAWALPRLPERHRAVLERARAGYLGDEQERWNELRPRVRSWVDYVVAEIERAPSPG